MLVVGLRRLEGLLFKYCEILGMERWMSMMMMMEMVEETNDWECCNRHCGMNKALDYTVNIIWRSIANDVFEVLN